MNIIYEPKGRAKEYSDLACNIYMGCPHGCKYCFAPSCMHTTADKWHDENVRIRKDALVLFRKDCSRLAAQNDQRPILFSFLSDPYQPIEREEKLTRRALEIAGEYRLRTKILTKGFGELIERDLQLMKEIGTELGITVSFEDDNSRREWEPNASPVSERFDILQKAYDMGIYTWVSLEPVIDPAQALAVIRKMHPYVDLWKVGKLNHMKEHESRVDWHKFHIDVEDLLNSLGARYYIKDDLKVK